MAKSGLMASTSTFAHLLGLGGANAGKPKAETDDERVKREDQEREDAKKAGKEGGKPKAEGGDDKPDDQGEDESDEDYKERKKREQEEAEDEEDDEDEKDAKKKAVRMRERARCSAIFASPAAGVRPDLAAHFAFATNLSRRDAVATLAVAAQGGAAPGPRKQGLSDRMGRQANPDLGRDPPAESGSGNREPKPHERILASFAMTQKPSKA